MRHAVFVPVLNWKHSYDTLWHNLKQTCLALHKQSKPENNPLSYKGGTSFWFPLHLQEYCYLTAGEVVFVLNHSHFSRSWWLPESLFPPLATFPYQSNFVKRWLYIKSRVRFWSQGYVLHLVGSQHSLAWHEVAESQLQTGPHVWPTPAVQGGMTSTGTV